MKTPPKTHEPCPQSPATGHFQRESAPAAVEPLLCVRALSKHFSQGGGLGGGRSVVRAVENVSLELFPGETLGIVGESGCGKSTLGRMVVGLLEPNAGDVFLNGLPLWNAGAHADYRAFRRSLAGRVQMIFQDPYSSLNPRMRIGESIAEPLVCSPAGRDGRGTAPRAAVRQRVAQLLQSVGLDPDAAGRYPHEFSGGQRQRIAIARALATRPDLVVCDEPTSSLDASVQSQVLNLLRDMQDELGLTYLFISHDLAVVRHMSDRVAVMYLGHVVESGGAEELFAAPLHPYTRLLLEAVPHAEAVEAAEAVKAAEAAGADGAEKNAPAGRGPKAGRLSGPLPAAGGERKERPGHEDGRAGRGCPFAPRCPERMERCLRSLPEAAAPDLPPHAGREKRVVRCFLYAP